MTNTLLIPPSVPIQKQLQSPPAKSKFLAALAATFYHALAACTRSGVGNPATGWGAADATSGVSMRVIPTRSEVVDGVEKRYFNLDVRGLPTDKNYDLFMLDFGMHRSGELNAAGPAGAA